MDNKTIECKSNLGLTIGLIDSIIYICRVLENKDFSNPEILEALKDLNNEQGFKKLNLQDGKYK